MFNTQGWRIRLLLEGDQEQVVYLVGLETLKYQSHIPFDRSRLLDTIRESLDTGQPIAWVAERVDGLILGFALGSLSGYRWSRAMQCRLETIYVHPEARRGGRVGVALFREYDNWTRIVGATESHCGVIHGIDEAATARWMRRQGYTPVGTNLRKVL